MDTLPKQRMFKIANSSITVLVLLGGVCIALSFFIPQSAVIFLRAAFLCFIFSASAVELRVRAAGRIPHNWIFWTHLTFAIPFFILLGTISFLSIPYFYKIAVVFLYIGTLKTGGILITSKAKI